LNRFITELRRREVFRTAGLYVGICWILIEVASILLPTFEAPEWILRAIVVVALVGFPVMLILAWVYDLTGSGVSVQAGATDTVVAPIGGRKMDFVVIGMLTVALIFSVYMNVTDEPDSTEQAEPISVLIADFENRTGEAIFDGLLEQALNIGIEGAPNITSYQRNDARHLAGTLQSESGNLTESGARLVAVREGIDVVLAGSIESDGSEYLLWLKGVDPTNGDTMFVVSSDADSRDAVLAALGTLSADAREQLGDNTLRRGDAAIAETFTAASIEAAQAYTRGKQLAYEGDHEGAVELYREAIALDPNFGRAYATIALSSSRLGASEESVEYWGKALTMMDTMTERERLRTLGVYYTSVTGNYGSAIDSFKSLVEKYPADAAGHNNLAVVYFLTLDFENARIEGRRILDIYPNSVLYRSNYALYAMYAGDFETATGEARQVIESDANFHKGYLPLAIAAMHDADVDAAVGFYGGMARTGARGDSLANVGIGDLELYTGNFGKAETTIEAGVKEDIAADNVRAAATKLIMLAETRLEQGESEQAVAALDQALELDSGYARAVPAAISYLKSGRRDAAAAIAESLSQQLQPQRRAYGLMIKALIDLQDGRTADAVDKLSAALEFADLWLVRLYNGRAFLEAGYPAEALSEFEAAAARHGEASAIFLDDTPTYRYLATLPYWLGRAQQELGMSAAAQKNLQAFLALRPHGGALTEDARARLE